MAIDVYQCELFLEPVLKQADCRHTDRIRRQVPEYTGRQCKTCEVFGEPRGVSPGVEDTGRANARRSPAE